MRPAGFHGLQYKTGKMQLAPGQHTFRLDYSQSMVPNLPWGDDAALLLQARPCAMIAFLACQAKRPSHSCIVSRTATARHSSSGTSARVSGDSAHGFAWRTSMRQLRCRPVFPWRWGGTAAASTAQPGHGVLDLMSGFC